MLGSMQDYPLRVSTVIDHAAKYHGKRPVRGRSAEGPIVESNWETVHAKAKKCAQALARMGYGRGDAIGVMAWNTVRHMEVWYGVSGCGAILHTLNPRLFAEQLDYIINECSKRWILVSLSMHRLNIDDSSADYEYGLKNESNLEWDVYTSVGRVFREYMKWYPEGCSPPYTDSGGTYHEGDCAKGVTAHASRAHYSTAHD